MASLYDSPVATPVSIETWPRHRRQGSELACLGLGCRCSKEKCVLGVNFEAKGLYLPSYASAELSIHILKPDAL